MHWTQGQLFYFVGESVWSQTIGQLMLSMGFVGENWPFRSQGGPFLLGPKCLFGDLVEHRIPTKGPFLQSQKGTVHQQGIQNLQ